MSVVHKRQTTFFSGISKGKFRTADGVTLYTDTENFAFYAGFNEVSVILRDGAAARGRGVPRRQELYALAQHAPAAAAVRLARVLERGGRARHCTGLAFDCAGLRETGLLLGGTLWASRPFCTVEKVAKSLFEKASLRSAPRLSAESGQFDAHSAQSVFCHAQAAAENGSYRFRVCGCETLRGFSIG